MDLFEGEVKEVNSSEMLDFYADENFTREGQARFLSSVGVPVSFYRNMPEKMQSLILKTGFKTRVAEKKIEKFYTLQDNQQRVVYVKPKETVDENELLDPKFLNESSLAIGSYLAGQKSYLFKVLDLPNDSFAGAQISVKPFWDRGADMFMVVFVTVCKNGMVSKTKVEPVRIPIKNVSEDAIVVARKAMIEQINKKYGKLDVKINELTQQEVSNKQVMDELEVYYESGNLPKGTYTEILKYAVAGMIIKGEAELSEEETEKVLERNAGAPEVIKNRWDFLNLITFFVTHGLGYGSRIKYQMKAFNYFLEH